MNHKLNFSRSLAVRTTVEDYSATELCALMKSIEVSNSARVVALNGTREMLEAVLNTPQLNYYLRCNYKAVIDAVEMGRCSFKQWDAPARATVVVTDHPQGARVSILGTEMSVVVPDGFVEKYTVEQNSVDGVFLDSDRFDFVFAFPAAVSCYHPLIKMLREASQHLECIDSFRSIDTLGQTESALRLFA
ncbi:hypothetical protein BIZ82_gp172 [Erwinia phage vB_EamM_EarlPhillipIV]|nr:hypothetical protein BIZ82_gp172 [Erwinia phage vB_EamM_EarlPhillipIV]ANZ49021.1 hypothetical protein EARLPHILLIPIV_172 [Erwinia phage vB_EamM_EarlPhillipIV]QXO09891.1 hypothetical protein pEaSNUABM38_00169 [Erwinia phage pEa_SNUABM_38]